MGASTSQFLATHVCLLAFDHRVKRALKVPGYVRHVDDVFLFGRRRADLRAWRAAMAWWIDRERALRWKCPAAPVISGRWVLDGLGYRITRTDRWARPRVGRRMMGRVAAAMAGGGEIDLARSISSSVGVLRC